MNPKPGNSSTKPELQEFKISVTECTWKQGGKFTFDHGDVVWLDKNGYETGNGSLVQIREAYPVIPAASVIVGKWSQWPDDLENMIKTIEGTGDKHDRQTSKSAKPEERCQLRKLMKRNPGQLVIDQFAVDGGDTKKITTHTMTQDEFVRALITGEGLL